MLLEVAQETYDQPEHIALLKEWFWKVRCLKGDSTLNSVNNLGFCFNSPKIWILSLIELLF